MTLDNAPLNNSTILSAVLRDSVRVLLIVEGINDIQFLRRIGRLLHNHDTSLPDLAAWECQGKLIFIPFGGGPVSAWSERLAPLQKAEVHIFDRELPPETENRVAAKACINQRPHCRAFVTNKRSLENYLHPAAILEVANVEVHVDDLGCVAEMVSQRLFLRTAPAAAWESLNRRTQRRLAYRAKRWLNTRAVDQMTLKMLDERDPHGEIRGWLRTIKELAGTH